MAAKKASGQKNTESASEAHAKRLKVLQKTKDDILRRIDGRGRGFLGRAIKARSVAPKVVAAVFQEMRDVVDAAETAYLEAQRNDDAAAVSRVDLTAV